jgi:hypothetical protein
VGGDTDVTDVGETLSIDSGESGNNLGEGDLSRSIGDLTTTMSMGEAQGQFPGILTPQLRQQHQSCSGRAEFSSTPKEELPGGG